MAENYILTGLDQVEMVGGWCGGLWRFCTERSWSGCVSGRRRRGGEEEASGYALSGGDRGEGCEGRRHGRWLGWVGQNAWCWGIWTWLFALLDRKGGTLLRMKPASSYKLSL